LGQRPEVGERITPPSGEEIIGIRAGDEWSVHFRRSIHLVNTMFNDLYELVVHNINIEKKRKIEEMFIVISGGLPVKNYLAPFPAQFLDWPVQPYILTYFIHAVYLYPDPVNLIQ